MISEEIEKTVTNVTTSHLLIIRKLRVTLAVTHIEKVTNVTNVTEKSHAKHPLLSWVESNL